MRTISELQPPPDRSACDLNEAYRPQAESRPARDLWLADAPQRIAAPSMDPDTRRHMRAEAARSAVPHPHAPPQDRPIPADERVAAQPDGLYRVPDWLAKTALPAQVAELVELLKDLKEANREFVGERVHEVAVYFTATGCHLDLRDRFQNWFDGYVRRRADPANMNPQVGPHPFWLHQKVWRELYGLFSPVANCSNSVHCGFLFVPLRYADWLAYDLLWKGEVRAESNGKCSVPGNIPGGEKMGQMLIDYAVDRNYLDDQMPAFLARVGAWAAGRGREIPWRPETLQPAITSLAEDIQTMRPLLAKNFRPEKTRMRLADDLWIGWNWQVLDGIGHVTAAESEADLLTALRTRWSYEGYVVRHDGLLGYRQTPWLTSAGLPGPTPLAGNYAVMELVRDRLFSFYDRIDRNRVERGVWPTAGQETVSGAVGQAIHTTLPVVTETERDGESSGTNRRVPGLRFQQFARTLGRLGCEVRQAKGSEVSVYRAGFRRCILGRHRLNREVFPAEVRRVTNRLGITAAMWLEAVRG